ncbi:MAG TPA: hypothetical protein DCZ10_15850 [Pelotomaculum sp.]|nr:hypothetical protein [Pelotomaculum sp.]
MEDKKPIRIYCNRVSIGLSTFDITLALASSFKGGEPDPEDIVAEVIMSPQHAKAFAVALGNNIRDYEKIYGDINLNPNQSALEEITKQQND